MIEVSSEVAIACSPDEVFTVIADMSRNPEWQSGMRSCEWTSAPPLAVGSTYDQVASFLGREILTSFEVTEYEARAARKLITGSTLISTARTGNAAVRLGA